MRRRWYAFLNGIGFLDAMLTSFIVLTVVVCCITILYRYFIAR